MTQPIFTLSLPDAARHSPRVLAHLGDGVYELLLREWLMALVEKGEIAKVEAVHQWTTKRASAAFQVSLLQALMPQLSETEQQLAKRARNVPVSAGRRSQQGLHRQSTAFEALFGYWYCVDKNRLRAIADLIQPWVVSAQVPIVENTAAEEI